MVTSVNIPQTNSQLKKLKEQASKYEAKLQKSPTAIAGEGSPTEYDLQNQTELERVNKAIRQLTNEKLRAQWYPPTDPTATAPEKGASSGFFGTTIDWMMRPIYAQVGAAQHFLGQTEGTLGESMAENILRGKVAYGGLLKTSGLPSVVAAPLGFALDVALDPTNWLTMGTGALIPRLAVGATKGVAKGSLKSGVALAAKSGALEKATTVARFTPGLKGTEGFKKLVGKTIDTTAAWEKFAGTTAEELVAQRGMGVGSYRTGLGEIFARVGDAIPGGEKFIENFNYDPLNWVKEAKMKQALLDTLDKKPETWDAIRAFVKGEPVEPYLKKASQEAAEILESTPERIGPLWKWNEQAIKISNEFDDAISIAKKPGPFLTPDAFEQARRNASLAFDKTENSITLDDIQKLVKSGALGETGVSWFDSFMTSIRGTKRLAKNNEDKIGKVGKETMNFYDKAMVTFRAFKVGASPSAWTNAVVGNMIMLQMGVGDIGATVLKRLKMSSNMYRNKAGSAAAIDKILPAEYRAWMTREGIATRGTLGTDAFLGVSQRDPKVLMQMAKDGGFEFKTAAQKRELADALRLANREYADLTKAQIKEYAQVKGATELGLKGAKGGTTEVRKLIEEGDQITRMETGGSIISEMFEHDAARQMLKNIEKRHLENPDNLAYKAMNYVYNKMPSGYASVDQSYKMSSILTSAVDGYTTNQLRRIRHLVNLDPKEFPDAIKMVPFEKSALAQKTGQMRYTLSPEKAFELANVLYLNYGAMPAAVRVLRNTPLAGSPFISFMYGMAVKTGQTMAYNPSAFTKMGFGLKEFGGEKTPFEKKALEGPYYSYLNQPGMYRMPGKFFDENPIYLNLANMIPYYSLNMFNPSETNFNSELLSADFVSFLQKSPLLKDPVGSVLFDYLIQPMILGEALAPQGQFGQPLYPLDAGIGKKALYGARTLGEAFVPGVAAYAGVPMGLMGLEGLADYIPSYRWRSLMRATKGKNQLGITSKESAPSKVLRGVASTSGIPVQSPVDLTFIKRNK